MADSRHKLRYGAAHHFDGEVARVSNKGISRCLDHSLIIRVVTGLADKTKTVQKIAVNYAYLRSNTSDVKALLAKGSERHGYYV